MGFNKINTRCTMGGCSFVGRKGQCLYYDSHVSRIGSSSKLFSIYSAMLYHKPNDGLSKPLDNYYYLDKDITKYYK